MNSAEYGGPLRSSNRSSSGSAGDGVVLVDDGGVHPGGEHLGPAGVRGAGDVAVGGRQVGQSGRGPHALQRRHVRVDGLRLIGGHQRAATGIAQQHNGFDALHLAQPAHADADVDQRVVEQEAALVAAEAGVPAEEADAAGGHVVGEVVLGEVDLIVRGDHRDLRLAADAAVVDPLARMPARTRPAARSGSPSRRTRASRPVSGAPDVVMSVRPPCDRSFGRRRWPAW